MAKGKIPNVLRQAKSETKKIVAKPWDKGHWSNRK